MVKSKLELLRQEIFDKQTEVESLEKRAKTLREECRTSVQRLRQECPHEEVSHQKGC